MMDDLLQKEIAQAGRAVVADIAPEELLLFRLHSEAFFRDEASALAPPKTKDDPLGFGAGELAGLMTPLVLMGIKTVVSCVAQDLGRELGVQARVGVRHIVQRLFGPPNGDSIALTAPQLQQVRAAVMAQIGPDRAMAQRVADAIVRALQNRPRESDGGRTRVSV
jgi:hypothetical protein